MQVKLTSRVGRLLLASTLLLLFGLVCFIPPSNGAPTGTAGTPSDRLVKLGMKFHGAGSCSSTDCHGAAEPKPPPGPTAAEYTLWADKDKHHVAFDVLKSEADAEHKYSGKGIAQKLGIADATTSQRCLSCHALEVPEPLRTPKFAVAEGVTCEACHGPSEKWLEKHSKPNWTDQQRQAAGNDPDKLLTTLGLFDTKSPLARAEKCTSCHLAIDADMVTAGHPQPYFELDYFSKSPEQGGVYEGRHWRDPTQPYYSARLWATGQDIAVRDAMNQLADRASAGAPADTLTTAYDQAVAHLSVLKHFLASGAVAVEAAEFEKAGTKLTAAGAKKDAAGPAKEIASSADKARKTINDFKPDKASTLKVLKSIVGDQSIGKTAQGREQQAYAIYALYSAYAQQEKPADAPQVTELIVNKLFEGETPLTAEQFVSNLAEVQKKLPQ